VLLDPKIKVYILKFLHSCSQIGRLLSDKQIGRFLFPRTHCSRIVFFFFLYNQYSTCQFRTICRNEFKDTSQWTRKTSKRSKWEIV